MRSPLIRLVAIFLGCFLIATACGGSTAAGNSDGFSIEAALVDVPRSTLGDTGATEISVIDFVGVADQTGLQRPSPGSTSSDELVGFYRQIIGSTSDGEIPQIFVVLPEQLRAAPVGAEEFVDEFGFAPGDVARLIEVRSGSSQFMVLDGVQARADLPQVAPGIGTIGEGDDGSVSPENRTTARPLGRPHRVAERDERLGISLQTQPLVEWLEQSAAATLGDDEVLMSLARELDDNKIVSAVLLSRADEPDFPPVALGWAVDDQGPFGVVVKHFGTDAAAEDNTELFRASIEKADPSSSVVITERITLESVERSGAQLVAKLRFPAESWPPALYDLYVRSEGPFSCCRS